MTAPTRVAFGHVENVELVETGCWPASTGPFTCTSGMIYQAVAALDCPAVRRPILKAGHGGEHGVGEPALGWCDNLRAVNTGQTLVADFRGMPAWLTELDPDGNSVMASAYPDRSIEGERDYRCTLGHTHPFVVHAVSLLGVERPAAGTLESLQELYGLVAATEQSDGGQVVVLTIPTSEARVSKQISAEATSTDVIRAYYDGPGSSWDLWVRELYIDPMELIVDNDATNEVLRVPYTIDAAGVVAFGDPQTVKVTYVAARATSGGPLVAFASRAESRPGERPQLAAPTTPPATPAGGSTTTTEGAGMTPEQLREGLGLPADASQIEVTAALAAGGHIPAVADAPAPTPPAPDTPPTVEAPPAPTTLPDGTVAVDEEAWRETVAAAAEGREARKTQLAEHRGKVVAAAINDGRIPPARKDHWLEQLAADPGAETVLAALKPGTVVALTELGHAGDDPANTVEGIRETPTYKNWSMA